MNHNIKCKFGCESGHPTTFCPKLAQRGAAVSAARNKVASIEAQPKPKPGSRPKKKKAKKRKKTKALKTSTPTTGVPE